MSNTDLEHELRRVLSERAASITPEELSASVVPATTAKPFARRTSAGPVRRGVAVAAAVVVLLGAAAVVVSRRDSATTLRTADEPKERTTPDGAAGGSTEATSTPPRWPVWPVLDDNPLPGGASADDLQSPERATHAFLASVADLPRDWPLGEITEKGDDAKVSYVLQDVPSTVWLARGAQRMWFVTRAVTDQFELGGWMPVEGGIDVSVGPGPRTGAGGGPVRLTAVASDGRTLARMVGRIPPPRRSGEAGTARIESLRWAGNEVAAAVRADALSDHDDNPATPDVVVGHASAAVPPAVAEGAPATYSLASAPVVFTGSGTPDEVAAAYLRLRFPDYPSPSVATDRARIRGRTATVAWSTGDDREPLARGSLFLRNTPEGWAIVAAMTDGVDLHGVERADRRIRGTVRTDNENNLAVDVLDPSGNPVPGSPHPDGQQGAEYRYGTAGMAGPGERSVDFDIADPGGVVVVRANLVGGTILAITEIALAA